MRIDSRRKMTKIVGNRGQLWTSTLSPHLLSPHLDFPDPCNFNTEMFMSKIGNLCPTLGQPAASRILCTLLAKSPGQDFVYRVAQKLVNSLTSLNKEVRPFS